MKLASAFTESPIRVKALDWPLHVSPVHGLQLQATAALKALSPVKSRHQTVRANKRMLDSSDCS